MRETVVRKIVRVTLFAMGVLLVIGLGVCQAPQWADRVILGLEEM